MNISHLQEFVFLSKTLSFRETARHFYLSQSVLSKHIAALEDELGSRLLVRDSHNVGLTEAGRVFAEDARAIIGDYERALLNIAAVADAHRTVLRIGYLRGASQPVLPELIRYFEQRHPEYVLNLRSMEYDDVINHFSANQVDVAISMDFGDMLAERCDCMPIYRDEMRVVMAPGHPLASREAVTPAELAAQRLLVPDRHAYDGMRSFVLGLLPEECRDLPYETYADVDTLYVKVQTQGYVGLSSTHNRAVFGDRVAFTPLEGPDASYEVCLYVRRGFDAAAARACLDAAAHCADYLARHRSDFPLGPGA